MIFAELARTPDPALDALALAMAAEFGPVDAAWACARLGELGDEVAAVGGDVAAVLGGRHGFAGDRERYDDPRNSMLDVVLRRRRGLPILLSVVYIEVGRRAGVAVKGVGLPGHFVVSRDEQLLDPFAGGNPVAADVPAPLRRPWSSLEIAMRMLNNLVGGFERRGDLSRALRAAELRLALPTTPDTRVPLDAELSALRARLN
ncbi:MAG: transglutaminase-like domain-containing protein [Solirubrobacteraceae bacterium]